VVLGDVLRHHGDERRVERVLVCVRHPVLVDTGAGLDGADAHSGREAALVDKAVPIGVFTVAVRELADGVPLAGRDATVLRHEVAVVVDAADTRTLCAGLRNHVRRRRYSARVHVNREEVGAAGMASLGPGTV
jgi:hypothetical protein